MYGHYAQLQLLVLNLNIGKEREKKKNNTNHFFWQSKISKIGNRYTYVINNNKVCGKLSFIVLNRLSKN